MKKISTVFTLISLFSCTSTNNREPSSIYTLEKKCESLKNIFEIDSKKKSSIISGLAQMVSPEILETLKHSSYLWSQQYAGADLAKKELNSRKNKKKYTNETKVSIADAQFVTRPIIDKKYPMGKIFKLHDYDPSHNWNEGNHGDLATSLIFSKSEASTAAKGMIHSIAFLDSMEDFPLLINAYEKIGYPDIISSSTIHWMIDKEGGGLDAVKKIIDNHSLIIASGGNNFFQKAPLPYIKNNIIHVGFTSDLGYPSMHSNAGSEIDILVPSGNHQISFTKESYHLFGASSGAAPVVAGVASNIFSILGINLSHDLFLKLVRDSALKKTWSSNNQVPVLNAYKAIKVAIKISNKCTQNSLDCIRGEIYNSENFIFNPRSDLNDYISKLKASNDSNCKTASILDEIRKDFFLTQSNSSGLSLKNFYNSRGLKNNGFFYDLFNISSKKPSFENISANDFVSQAHELYRIDQEKVHQKFIQILKNIEKENFNELDYLTKMERTKIVPILLYQASKMNIKDLEFIFKNIITKIGVTGKFAINYDNLFFRSELHYKVAMEIVKDKELQAKQNDNQLYHPAACFLYQYTKSKSIFKEYGYEYAMDNPEVQCDYISVNEM